MTGGAVDLTIRYKQKVLTYVAGANVELLRQQNHTNDSCNPDYGEYAKPLAEYWHEDWQRGVNYRRILFNLLSSVGMQVNPHEYWHWSYGDKMWALLQNQPAAFYGTAAVEQA